ncbi:MAG: ribonuclease III [Candidatus Zixiibacteriota bacterium]|nr:MAG: ribonuclease III [candidate division Zixibacteria bacterium]
MVFSLIKRLFSGKKDPLGDVEKVLNYRFQNRDLLKKALTHRSWENAGLANERLEFLGDAVLGLVVSGFLFREFPDLKEGDLTKMKSSLVNESVLTKIFSRFGLADYLYLSSEEEKSGGREKSSITADAMEAILGAIYLDGGLERVSEVINQLLLSDYDSLINDEAIYNYKGELLELVQNQGRGIPRYEVVEEIGPDHDKVFVVSVSVESEIIGTGKGTTKKDAEQKAARMALEFLSNNPIVEN